MVDQNDTTDNTGRVTHHDKPKTSRHNVTNPTRADHVINTVDGKKMVIPAGKVVENVEIADTEVESLKDTHKKMGDGNFISLTPGSGGNDGKGPEYKPLPSDQLTRSPRPGDEPSKDKSFDPARNPLPGQDTTNVARETQGKPAQQPVKK